MPKLRSRVRLRTRQRSESCSSPSNEAVRRSQRVAIGFRFARGTLRCEGWRLPIIGKPGTIAPAAKVDAAREGRPLSGRRSWVGDRRFRGPARW